MAERRPRRGPVPGPRWTEADDARLRALATPSGLTRPRPDWPRLTAAFPGRTRSAVQQRLKRLRLSTSGRRWTAAEDETLRRTWTELGGRSVLARLPGRSWGAVVARALNLGLSTIPQGWSTLAREAARLGVDPRHARSIVAWSRAWAPLVASLCAWGHACARAWERILDARGEDFECPERPPDGWDGGAVSTARHSLSLKRPGGSAWVLVEEAALDEAVVAWLRWETTGQAARRLGVSETAMRAAAARWPVAGKGRGRLRPPEWHDAAAREAGLRGGALSLSEHARRLGLTQSKLRVALARVGWRSRGQGASMMLLEEDVARALAAPPKRRRAAAAPAADLRRAA